MATESQAAAATARLAALTDPARVRRARESQALTQAQLAERLVKAGHPISPAALSQIERGVTRPSPETLVGIAGVLSYPITFFVGRSTSAGTDEREPVGYFRSLRSTSARERRRALANAHLIHDLVLAVDRRIRLPELDLPALGDNTPEDAAMEVRRRWDLPHGPVGNVVRELERHGVVVVRLAEVGAGVDAFSVNFPDRPVVVLGNDKGKRDRSRFDASHELAHLVLHRDREPDVALEAEAHRFAAEFLMPAADIEAELAEEKLTWARLLSLKLRWGTSIAALVRRARDLGEISGIQYTNMMKAISARGWRRDEPGDRELGPPEASAMLDLIEDHFRRGGTSLADIADEAGLPLDPLRSIVEASRDPRPRLRI